MAVNLSKISRTLIAGSLICGCAYYKPIAVEEIKPVVPVSKIEKNDYSSWQEAIESVSTPKQVKDYFQEHMSYKTRHSIFFPGLFYLYKQKGSFRNIHETGSGNCLDYAVSAAALLSDNNYPPLILDMGKENFHAVFLYKTEDGYGALGNTCMDPVHPTVDSLVTALSKRQKIEYDKYLVYNLDENFEDREWIYGEIDLNIGFRRIGMDKVKK